jgi:uncharacterized hydrophobic protein (TIGR00271 family)
VLSLRLSVAAESAEALAEALRGTGAVRRLAHMGAAESSQQTILFADVMPAGAEAALQVLDEFDVASEDYLLSRLEVVAPTPAAHARFEGADVAWVEVLGQARANARPLARYLALIVAAGVIASMGVLTANGILIVGAMAVSPDLLPICATCVGIVGGRRRLTRQAFFTLVVGLGLVVVVATVASALLNATGFVPSDYQVGEGGLSDLAHTDYSTVLVALAAGVAAMLSFETRASAAVGVAISVTTIPASAYLGVAIGVGEKGAGALLVLVINVALLIASGSLTLALQRRISERRRAAGR